MVTDSTPRTAPAPYPAFDGTQACTQIGTEAFFPAPGMGVRHTAVAMPVAVCASCPFVEVCLDYALTHDVTGIWGGTTHQRRKKIRAERGIRAHVVHDVSITRLSGHRGAA